MTRRLGTIDLPPEQLPDRPSAKTTRGNKLVKHSNKRNRRLFSIKDELLVKSKEAALAAIQIFNNPSTTFKSETFTVLMVIAWTYLLHAWYRSNKIEYRYYKKAGKRKRFDRTKHKAIKHWELERCLDAPECPLEGDVKSNLKFLIGLRHEIEHQMTTRIDELLSARFQACAINYAEAIVHLFGSKHAITDRISVSIQLSALTSEQVETLDEHEGLPPHLKKFISGFDSSLDVDVFQSPKFAYRVIFVPKLANRPNQADKVISFIKADSKLAENINAQYTVIKETERQKWLPSRIVDLMRSEGYSGFSMHHHTQLWKAKNAKNPTMNYGVQVANTWYWYDSWVEVVRDHCRRQYKLALVDRNESSVG